MNNFLLWNRLQSPKITITQYKGTIVPVVASTRLLCCLGQSILSLFPHLKNNKQFYVIMLMSWVINCWIPLKGTTVSSQGFFHIQPHSADLFFWPEYTLFIPLSKHPLAWFPSPPSPFFFQFKSYTSIKAQLKFYFFHIVFPDSSLFVCLLLNFHSSQLSLLLWAKPWWERFIHHCCAELSVFSSAIHFNSRCAIPDVQLQLLLPPLCPVSKRRFCYP